MSKIDELIQQYCPEGVEFVAVPDFAELKAGKAIVSSDLEKDATPLHPYPCFGGNGIRGYIGKMSHDGEYAIIGRQGALCGCVNWGSGKFYATEHAVVCTPKANAKSRYLFYLFSNADLNQYKSQGAQPGLSVQRLNELYFPLPPLPVQEEIVRILDTFTELQAELQTELQSELQARQQQYQYYRDQLLAFEGRTDVEWKKLGEVATIKNGKDYKHLNDGTIPVYGSGGVMTYVDTFAYDKPSVLLPRKGSIGNVFYTDTPFWTVDTCYYTEINDMVVLPKYLYYVFTTKDLTKLNTASGAVPSLTQSVLYNVEIPIPSLEEQEKIVSILDRFDTLVNDLSQGLPAEIEARQQQYEYYRDKLLTFKRK